MSTEAGTEAPTKAPCWPNDPDYLDGRTEIEVTTKRVRAYWDADILDIDDKNQHDTIIERTDPFEVRFRVELVGRIWRCMCGHWCFDIGLSAIGEAKEFYLSSVLPDPSVLEVRDWKGCDTLCIERIIQVPGGKIPTGTCGTLYEVGAKFELRCCGCCRDEHSHLAVAGQESLGQYMFA